ncbi:MAG TPA: IclR family transcriptional regulator [Caldilineaceae bacterium]|nr:IclR family transcriptional regulator [Caldilineaceae bacterium]
MIEPFHIVEQQPTPMAEIQSLARAFDILRAVATESEGRSLAAIARQVDLPKSTVSRMLSTLEKLGAVERVTQPEGFRIGDEIVALASQVSYPRSLAAMVRPHLQTLAQAVGETVALAIPDGDQVYYVDQIDSWRNLRLKDWTGHRLPLYATSDGKLYLAHWPAARLEEYLHQPFYPHSPNTRTDPTLLRTELATIRQVGYAWNQREYDPDLAAPIRDEQAQIIASICIFGPFFRFPPEGRSEELIALVVEAGQAISTRLQTLASRSRERGVQPLIPTN